MRDSSICEPHFSFVQVYDPPEQQNRNRLLFGQELDQSDTPVLSINQYIHFAKFGSGHTGAYQKVNKQGLWRDFEKLDWECEWWSRTTKLDSWWRQPGSVDNQIAAEQYSNRTVIGSLFGLRQFLEQSILKTNRTYNYLSMFELMLNDNGRLLFNKRSREFGFDNSLFNPRPRITLSNQQLAKFVLGFTRKRNLLVSEWADDDKLWAQKKELLTL